MNELDLDPIMFKLMDIEDGEGWSREQTETVAAQYRNFLLLHFENRTVPLVPTKLIDKFWHHHILDTEKYARDCDLHLGYFLHHYPYFGLRGDADRDQLRISFENTCRLYEQRFGLPYTTNLEASEDGSCTSPGCGSVVCGVGECTAIHAISRPTLQQPARDAVAA